MVNINFHSVTCFPNILFRSSSLNFLNLTSCDTYHLRNLSIIETSKKKIQIEIFYKVKGVVYKIYIDTTELNFTVLLQKSVIFFLFILLKVVVNYIFNFVYRRPFHHKQISNTWIVITNTASTTMSINFNFTIYIVLYF